MPYKLTQGIPGVNLVVNSNLCLEQPALIIPAKAFARDYGITGVRLSVCYHDN